MVFFSLKSTDKGLQSSISTIEIYGTKFLSRNEGVVVDLNHKPATDLTTV